MPRGVFVVFEGCDGAGKSTQVQKLATSGIFASCERMAFPDRTTPIGGMIDQYLRNAKDISDQAIHLLFSANRWELAGGIESLLAQGTSIICDRYWFSGTAYSAAKGIDMEWCKMPEVGLPRPDLVLLLDLDVAILANRKGFGAERYEKLDLQKRVRDAYMQLRDDSWILINANQSVDDVAVEVMAAVKAVIDNK
jgi:dTMP kinase